MGPTACPCLPSPALQLALTPTWVSVPTPSYVPHPTLHHVLRVPATRPIMHRTPLSRALPPSVGSEAVGCGWDKGMNVSSRRLNEMPHEADGRVKGRSEVAAFRNALEFLAGGWRWGRGFICRTWWGALTPRESDEEMAPPARRWLSQVPGCLSWGAI